MKKVINGALSVCLACALTLIGSAGTVFAAQSDAQIASDAKQLGINTNHIRVPDSIGPDQLQANDRFMGIAWHLQATNVGKAWAYLKYHPPSRRIRVVVLDTGCNLSQADLKVNVNSSLAVDVTRKSGNSYAKLTRDVDTVGYHGTVVTETIAATANNGIGTAGVASGYNNNIVEVVPVCVASKVDSFGNPDIDTNHLVDGLNYAKSIKADVVNCSLGTSNDVPALKSAVNSLLGSGIVICGSAGNDNSKVQNFVCDYPGVIGVMSVGMSGKLFFSNFGYDKNICAPGEKIVISMPDDNVGKTDAAACFQMTSAATPIVSGACALIKAAHPNYSVDQIRNAIYNNAMPISGGGLDATNDHGFINIGNAVDSTKVAVTASTKWVKLLEGNSTSIGVNSSLNYLPATAKSSKTSCVTVSQAGGRAVVKGVKKGSATITYALPYSKVNAALSTKVKVLKNISLTASGSVTQGAAVGSYTAKKGKTAQMVVYKASSKQVKYTTSNKKIATVSQKGVVKFKKKGTVVIKAKVVGASGSDTITITVK